MGERDLARHRARPAADEALRRDRVVRCAEGPLRRQPAAADAGDAVDLGDLERLLEGRRRQDPRQPAREHRLARRRAARPSAGCGRPPPRSRAPAWRRPGRGRRRGRRACSSRARRGQRGDRPAPAPSARGAGRRAGRARGCRSPPPRRRAPPRARWRTARAAANGPRRALRARRPARPGSGGSRPTATARRPARSPRAPRPARAPQAASSADRDRQVEARARLAHVRGREVDGDALLRKAELRVEQRRPHALARLAHGAVRQADERERRQAAADVDLDGDLVAADALQGEGGDGGEHGRPR